MSCIDEHPLMIESERILSNNSIENQEKVGKTKGTIAISFDSCPVAVSFSCLPGYLFGTQYGAQVRKFCQLRPSVHVCACAHPAKFLLNKKENSLQHPQAQRTSRNTRHNIIIRL